MAIIDVYLSDIANAVYGSEMRSAIYSAMSTMLNATYGTAEAVEAFQRAMPDLSAVINAAEAEKIIVLLTSNPSGRIDLSEISALREYAFYDCGAIEQITLDNCRSIGANAFDFCYNLSSVYIPVCSYIGTGAFRQCSALNAISLPCCETIRPGAFYSCHALESIYFLGSSVPEIVAAMEVQDPFDQTPIKYSNYLGHYGSIYVYASMVNAFKTASNWSIYSERITEYVPSRQ